VNVVSDHLYSLCEEGIDVRMSNWYSVSLGDGLTASMPMTQIEAVFLESFIAAGRPPNMAVFTRPESEDRLHCEVIAYFSPAAREVAIAFDAKPCAKPAPNGLGLLAGDQRAWPMLFPEASA
jgi:hypothetical protein